MFKQINKIMKSGKLTRVIKMAGFAETKKKKKSDRNNK